MDLPVIRDERMPRGVLAYVGPGALVFFDEGADDPEVVIDLARVKVVSLADLDEQRNSESEI